MRISDWSSDVCSSDLIFAFGRRIHQYPAAGAGLETEITSEAGVGRRRREVCVSQFQLLQRPVARSGGAGIEFNGGIHGFGKVIRRSACSLELVREYNTPALLPQIVPGKARGPPHGHSRSEEPTSELQSLMRIPYAASCSTKKHNHH